MTPEFQALVQLGIAAGFVFAAYVLARLLKEVVDAWRKGEFVSRAVFDEVVKANEHMRLELGKNTRVLRSLARSHAKSVLVLERITSHLEEGDAR